MYAALKVLLVVVSTKMCLCVDEGFVIRHYSGLCLALHNETNFLYLTRTCSERFQWTAFGAIMHVKSSLCLMPENDSDDTKIVAKDDCRSLFAFFMLSSNHSLQHVKTRKCLHPYWGCPVPSQGETVVLHTACDQERLAFEFIKENKDCKPLYPYCDSTLNEVTASSSCMTNEKSKGLDWHWVYIIVTTGGTILIGQFIFILCIYCKMARKFKQSKEKSIQFGRSARKEEPLPGNDSEDIHMISITTKENSTPDSLHDEFSDSSSIDTIAAAPTDADKESKDERTYINIDYNQNKHSFLRILKKRKGTKERNSKRLSKLSIDVSKMRQMFRIRKSYTLNDLEILKRISIEKHEYEEPISPFSTCSAPCSERSNAKGEKSEYIEPDSKCTRGRSASVPAKLASQQGPYLKPVISERDRRKFSEGSYTSYVNIKPSSPTRTERNLYDIPQMALIEEDTEDCPLQVEAHTYVKILEA